MTSFLDKIFLQSAILSMFILFAAPIYADDAPKACASKKGVFTSSSHSVESKVAASKAKYSELEKKELVQNNCVSGIGNVIQDLQGNFTVECEVIKKDGG